jgi:hypothetical protein
MTTTRIAAAVAAGGLAIGLLAGSAGTIIARDATTTTAAVDCTAHMSQMQSMMSGAGSMMSGAGSMMDGASGMMNGTSGMMNSQGGTAPEASSMPDWMSGHHPSSSPVPTR